jgi:hypothetical protein
MKKRLLMLLCLLTLALPMIAAVTPAYALSYQTSWVNPTYMGYDPSYGRDIVGYQENTNWNFTLLFTNDGMVQLNVSAIRLYFNDLTLNLTKAYSPVVNITAHSAHIFNVGGVTPSIQQAPEQWTYSYAIFVDTVNKTGGYYASYDVSSGTNFAILSSDHLTCLTLYAKYNSMFSAMVVASPIFYSNISRVQVFMFQSMWAFNQGTNLLDAQQYSQAKTFLQQGDTLFGQALSAWDTLGTARDNATTNYTNALGNAAMNNAYGWMFFGIGWILIGLGVIIFGARRPRIMQANPPPAAA